VGIILSYAIRIAVSTVFIYLSIQIVDRGNYRNKISNALITAVILSFAGMMPFVFLFGVIAWVYILINWYSIGFFRSFLCVVVYVIMYICLNIALAMAFVGGAIVVGNFQPSRVEDTQAGTAVAEGGGFSKWLAGISKKTSVSGRGSTSTRAGSTKKQRFMLMNGRSIEGSILMEGRKAYLLDVANGRSEVVIRKDTIDWVEDVDPAGAK
jgi:type IV secretory pathway VirB6-like protein